MEQTLQLLLNKNLINCWHFLKKIIIFQEFEFEKAKYAKNSDFLSCFEFLNYG
jgi:hypothetical protein